MCAIRSVLGKHSLFRHLELVVAKKSQFFKQNWLSSGIPKVSKLTRASGIRITDFTFPADIEALKWNMFRLGNNIMNFFHSLEGVVPLTMNSSS